jgi:hypothetical protein
MTKIEKLEAKIADLAGDGADIFGLLEDLRAATRDAVKTDLIADIQDPRMELTTATEVTEFIKSNY